MASKYSDTFIFFFIVFGSLLFFAIYLYFLSFLPEAFGQDPDTNLIIQAVENGAINFDRAIAVFFLVFAVLNFATGFFDKKMGIFFYVEILSYTFFGIPLAVIFQNIATYFLEVQTPYTIYLLNFPFATNIIDKLVVFFISLVSFYFIGAYVRRNTFIIRQ